MLTETGVGCEGKTLKKNIHSKVKYHYAGKDIIKGDRVEAVCCAIIKFTAKILTNKLDFYQSSK